MFKWLAKKSYTPQERIMFRFLRRCQIFEHMEDGELAEFLPYLHPRKYQKNEAIFFRGDPSQALYVIRQGEVILNLDVQDKFEELLRLRTGDSFGDNAVLEGAKRNFNAIAASENCEIFVIAQVNILDIFQDHLNIKAKMLGAFSRYYDKYVTEIVRSYRDTYGFFELGKAYLNAKR
ncbi:MAG: cyclic nucleotide-binding domain-containing protein [Bernardetiaceae bacterium]|jgi:CRP-like cAMP-binding protein|nr:cyclic nucleotide-binding domain-containing protein [Bernardetiaceae bacterium]